MQQIIQEVQNLRKPKTIPLQSDDDIRNQYKAIQLSKEAITILSGLQTQVNLDHGNVVYLRVFIQDVLDEQICVGGIRHQDNVVLYPFGQDVETVEGEEILFDRVGYKARVLGPNRTFEATGQELTIFSFSEECPKIFNVVNVIGIVEQFENKSYLNAIEFITPQQEALGDVSKEYESFVGLIDRVLMDKLSSQWIALTILSKVEWKIYEEGGRQVLNVSGINSDLAQQLQNQLNHLVSPIVQLSLENNILKTKDTLSSKNLETNEMNLGTLIAPTNMQSLIIVDETIIKEGQIDGQALMNITNIQKFISNSKIGIDYTYSMVEIPIQTSVIILSQGQSFLKYNFNIKHKHIDIADQIQQNQIPCFDNFIQFVQSRIKGIQLTDPVKEYINNKYIELRKQPDLQIESGDLNRWIIVMKVLTVIHNQGDQATVQLFEESLQLDLDRMMRNKSKQ